MALDDLIQILAEFHSLEGEKQDLRLPKDPGLSDALRGFRIMFVYYMVAYLKSFYFILEFLVPSLVESLTRLDVEVDRAQFLNPSGDFIFEDGLYVWLILEEAR